MKNFEALQLVLQNDFTQSGFSPEEDMECNATCCVYDEDGKSQVICFTDFNFTDYGEIHQPEMSEIILRAMAITPLFFVGVVGNLVVISILLKNRILMRTSVNCFLLNMAIADFLLASTGPLTFTIRELHQFWVLGDVWCHMEGFIQVTVMLASVLSLSIISVDRMLGILYPMHLHLKSWQALVINNVVWIFSMVCGIPFYKFRVYGVREWKDVTEVYCNESSELTKIYWFINIIVLNWLPILVMIICYLRLFLGFKDLAMKVEGKEHPGILKTKKRFVKLLFTMIICFMVCWTPFQVFIIFREKIIFADEGQVKREKLYEIGNTVGQYMVYCNPCINPFIYALMHSNFRRGFQVTFPCLFKEKPKFRLMAGHGRHAFVWNRNSIRRHTICEGKVGRRNAIAESRKYRALNRTFSAN